MHGAPIAACRPGERMRILSIHGLSVLQAVLFAVALVQFLRCAGPARIWMGMGLAVPLLRLTIRSEYRRRVLERIRLEWADIEAFADDPSRLPWRATALLIVLPA